MHDFERRQFLRSAASFVRPTLIFGTFRASFACQNQTESTDPSPLDYDVPEAYEIYSDLLNLEDNRREAVIRSLPKEHLVLIASETCSLDRCVGRENEYPSLFLPAIRDYKELIKSKWLLLPNFRLDKAYDFLSLEEFAKFDRQSFLDTYPDSRGCVMFAPVGFNKQKTVAVVFIARVYPQESGSGTLRTYKKEKDGWSQSDGIGAGCGSATDSGST